MDVQEAAVAAAVIAALVAAAGVWAQLATLRHQQAQMQRAAVALFVREIAAGRDSDGRVRRDAWFRLRGADVATIPAVDDFALADYSAVLRSAAAQWAFDEHGYADWEVFGHVDGGETAQMYADATNATVWRVTYLSGTELVTAPSEAEARTEFLFALGALREGRPSLDRIRAAMAERVSFGPTDWVDFAVPGDAGPNRQQPRTPVSIRTRDDVELLGDGHGGLMVGTPVSPGRSQERAVPAEHDRIRQQFRQHPITFRGPFVPTRNSPR